jgi:hypothetical protein
MGIFPLTRRLATAATSLRLLLNGQVLAPDVNNKLTLPVEAFVMPGIGDPTLFQSLLNQVMTQAVQTSTQVQASLDQLRALTTATTGLSYYVAYPAPGRVFQYDPTDHSTLDDGVLTVVSSAGLRFKHLPTSDVYISWLGCTPFNGAIGDATDASVAFLTLTQLLNQRGLQNKWINFPAGRYRWTTPVITNTDQFNNFVGGWRCTDGVATMVTNGTGNIWFTSNWLSDNIQWDAGGAPPVLDAQGNRNNDYKAQEYKDKTCVRVSMTCKFRNFQVNNCAGHGMRWDGNVGFRNAMFPFGSNSSCSTVDVYQFQGNGGAAIYIDGPDENSGDNNEIYFTNGDAAGLSNNGWGYIDRSFLGCRRVNCQHNSNLFGHIIVDSVNSKSSQIGIYEEDTNPDYPSRITGNSRVEGRFTGAPVISDSSVLVSGRNQSHIITPNIIFTGGGTGMQWAGANGATQKVIANDNALHLTQNIVGDTNYMLEEFATSAKLQSLGESTYRFAHAASIGLRSFYLGSRHNLVVTTNSLDGPADTQLRNVAFEVADRVFSELSSPARPDYWVCISGGDYARAGQSLSVTATVGANDGGQPRVSDASKLSIGDWFTLNGSSAKVLGFQTSGLLITSGYFAVNSTAQTLVRALPLFKAACAGSLTGPLASRPTTLGVQDAGLRYYVVDPANAANNQDTRWTGSAWQAIA